MCCAVVVKLFSKYHVAENVAPSLRNAKSFAVGHQLAIIPAKRDTVVTLALALHVVSPAGKC